jgi:hypothetical protein
MFRKDGLATAGDRLSACFVALAGRSPTLFKGLPVAKIKVAEDGRVASRARIPPKPKAKSLKPKAYSPFT